MSIDLFNSSSFSKAEKSYNFAGRGVWKKLEMKIE